MIKMSNLLSTRLLHVVLGLIIILLLNYNCIVTYSYLDKIDMKLENVEEWNNNFELPSSC